MTSSNDGSTSAASGSGSTSGATPGSHANRREQRRTRTVSAVMIGVLLLIALVFRKPLVAWFTGSGAIGTMNTRPYTSRSTRLRLRRSCAS